MSWEEVLKNDILESGLNDRGWSYWVEQPGQSFPQPVVNKIFEMIDNSDNYHPQGFEMLNGFSIGINLRETSNWKGKLFVTRQGGSGYLLESRKR